MTQSTRRALGGLSLCAALAAALPAMAAPDPAAPGPVDGRVTINAHSAAVGVGWDWGGGVLTYRHHTYHFDIKGLTVAAVGYSSIVGHGRVYNLHNIGDFTGTYASSTGAVTAGKGIGGQALINGQGVQLRLDEVTRGAELSGSADGIQISLRR